MTLLNQITSSIRGLANAIGGMTTDQQTLTVTLLAACISAITFFYGKRFDFRLKLYELKRKNYEQILDVYTRIMQFPDEDDEIVKTLSESIDELTNLIAVNGSKAVCKKFIFLRSFFNGGMAEICDAYNEDVRISIILYLLIDLFVQIRKELGQSFTSDITADYAGYLFAYTFGDSLVVRKLNDKVRFRIIMIKFELLFLNASEFTHVHRFLYRYLFPIALPFYFIAKRLVALLLSMAKLPLVVLNKLALAGLKFIRKIRGKYNSRSDSSDL